MLMDLTQPLREGDTVPVTLTFADKDGRKITRRSRRRSALSPRQRPL
jgi:copper(I)-binding protein